MRVAMFQEIISPYRIPTFNEIHRKANFDFKAFFLRETQSERYWPIDRGEIQFPYEVLPGIVFEGRNLRALHINFNLFSKLKKDKFDIIVTGGWHQPSYYLLLLYAKLTGKKILFWSESTKTDWRLNSFPLRLLRQGFVKWSSGAIVAGKNSKEYLYDLGVDPKKVWLAPNAVDNSFYFTQCQIFKKDKERIKKQKNLPKKILLYSGRLVKEKGALDLLAAYAQLVREYQNIGLIFCGDGEERSLLVSFCEEHKLENVFFTGFIQREEMALYYALADIFILPSYSEPWGLVLNEAMNCGLPVISSSHVGASGDLVHSGENGFTFKPGAISELLEKIIILLNDEEKRIKFGEASSRIIEEYSPTRCADGFIKAVSESSMVES